VNQLCESYQKHIASKPQIDTYLIMDDIIEKLSLLDYENSFCKGWKHKRISRIYWAHPPSVEEEKERMHMLYDMVYWLMSLNKEQVSQWFTNAPCRPRNWESSSTTKTSRASQKRHSIKWWGTLRSLGCQT